MAQSQHLEDETDNYMMSISDLMSALLFIFIITLAAFILSFQAQEDKSEEKEKAAEADRKTHERIIQQLTNASEVRAYMLRRIQTELDNRSIEIQIDEKRGVLRLTEKAILFESGNASLREPYTTNLRVIAEVLAQVVPCFTVPSVGVRQFAGCNSDYRGKLESIFVEGHTDSVPIRNREFADNWELSAQRAIETFQSFIETKPILAELRNTEDTPVFSVSGYSDSRPVPDISARAPLDVHRRIELRFIMTPPRGDEKTEVEKSLQKAGAR